MKVASKVAEPTQHRFEDDTVFPNSHLPVPIYRAALAAPNDGASSDFRVVGAYPDGTGPDMQYGKPGERPGTERNIAAVPAPGADPVHGGAGPLVRLWRRAT